MLSLRPERLSQLSLPLGTGWLLGACMEARGKQDLWSRQKPEVLAALREQAIIQSAESSNRIEGVAVRPERLRPLVLGQARPVDRPEEELQGYRRALDWIFKRRRPIRLDPATVLKLHALAQGGTTGDAGRFKRRDNDIVEILPNGERRIRFVPTPARETPEAVHQLCENHAAALEDERIPPLVVAATFVLDFLCIHPFRDGNGRVSRLLTTLLLEQGGFVVARFVSLERLVEESKVEYYRCLEECSRGWHQGRNDLLPWIAYFLSTLRRAYQEFERRVQGMAERPAKTELIRDAVGRRDEPFTLAEIRAQVPGVSVQLVKKVLAELKRAGVLKVVGHGRGALWKKAGGGR